MFNLVDVILKGLQQNYFVWGFLSLLSFLKSFKGRSQQLNTQPTPLLLVVQHQGATIEINLRDHGLTLTREPLEGRKENVSALNSETGKATFYIPWEQASAGPDWSPGGNEEFSGGANEAIRDVQGFRLLRPVQSVPGQALLYCVCLGNS